MGINSNQIAVIAVIALLLSVIGLGAVAYSYSDSGAQAIGISRRVSTYNIIDNAITNAKMADNSIDSAEYVNGSIDNAHISDDAINSSQIIDDTIDSADYAAGSIDNEHKAENNSYWTVTFDKEGQYTTTTDPIATFQMPFAATLVEVSASAVTIDTVTGDETYVLDLEETGVSVLTAADVNITVSNTPVVGTISDTAIADDAVMEVTLTLAGTTPTLDDLTVVIVFKKAHVAA